MQAAPSHRPSPLKRGGRRREGQLQQRPSRRRVPEPQDAVPGVGGQEAALRVERQVRDLLHVARQGRHLALRGHVPDLDARVGTRDGQALAVRMPGDDLAAHRADGQVGEEGPARRVVHGNDLGTEVAHGQLAAVRVERHRVGPRGQAPAPHFPTRRQIEAEDPFLLADRQAPAVGAERMRRHSRRSSGRARCPSATRQTRSVDRPRGRAGTGRRG